MNYAKSDCCGAPITYYSYSSSYSYKTGKWEDNRPARVVMYCDGCKEQCNYSLKTILAVKWDMLKITIKLATKNIWDVFFYWG